MLSRCPSLLVLHATGVQKITRIIASALCPDSPKYSSSPVVSKKWTIQILEVGDSVSRMVPWVACTPGEYPIVLVGMFTYPLVGCFILTHSQILVHKCTMVHQGLRDCSLIALTWQLHFPSRESHHFPPDGPRNWRTSKLQTIPRITTTCNFVQTIDLEKSLLVEEKKNMKKPTGCLVDLLVYLWHDPKIHC